MNNKEEKEEKEVIIPFKLIQNKIEWEIISFLRFNSFYCIINEVNTSISLSLPLPLLITSNSFQNNNNNNNHNNNNHKEEEEEEKKLKNYLFYGSSILQYLYKNSKKNFDETNHEVVLKRNYLKYKVQEIVEILILRENINESEYWFGTNWLFSYYDQVKNHFKLYWSPWTQTDNPSLIQELDESFEYIESNYLQSSKYLDGESPHSCDALLFANLVKLYSIEISSLKPILDKHTILKDYFEMICNVYFRNTINPIFKQSNDVLYPPQLRSSPVPKKSTTKQKELFTVFGTFWKPLTTTINSHEEGEKEGGDQQYQFKVESLIQDSSCITPKYQLPTFNDILLFNSKVSLNKNQNSFYISPSGLLFSSVVIGTFLYSTFKRSKY